VPSADTPTATELGIDQLPAAEELGERQLERARVILAGRTVEAEYLAEVGDAAERLLEVGVLRGADLLVVGSRDHGFFERLFSRPVEETVARRADTDVLLVH
jgi:nucleotide-binding universal stress UspA family protein